MNPNLTLVVMAAGMGSRFGGLKQLEPIGNQGEVILDFSVYDALEAGFNKIVFVIKHQIEEDFKKLLGNRIAKKVKVEYVFQENDKLPDGYPCPEGRLKPWGTAHAVLCCKDVVKEPFAVINADDYYGKTAFQKIASFLKNNRDMKEYCMTGFRLCNTLTENGTVSRGICETEAGYLKSVTERTKIVDCNYTEDEGKTWIPLAPESIVSMNLWGFMPDFFDYIEEGFLQFLQENLHHPKAEYYLPSVVSHLIEENIKRVKVLVAEEKWYGITYKEDKENVENALSKMIQDHLYDGII